MNNIEPGLISINLIASSVSPAGDGVFNAETISSAVGNALASDPVALADVLSEMACELYRMNETERLCFLARFKAAQTNRAYEIVEFLFDALSAVVPADRKVKGGAV